MTSPDHVESFARGLSVLRAFGADCRSASLSDIARRTGLQRAAARRFLLTLCDLGYAAQTGRQFALTPRVLELGFAYLSALEFPEIIQAHLTTITATLRESSSAAILDGHQIVYVARSAAPQRIMGVTLGVGYRLPAHATSMGLALLAELPDHAVQTIFAHTPLEKFSPKTIGSIEALLARLAQIRTQGYAIADEELEIGLRSLSIPISSSPRRPAFAINVATNAARTSLAELEQRFLPILQQAAKRCAADVNLLG